MTHTPSSAQLAAYQARNPDKPVVLFYRYRSNPGTDAASIATRLDQLARMHGGQVDWSGAEEQALIGPVQLYGHCCLLRFRLRDAALRHIQDSRHAEALRDVDQLEVTAISDQPRLSRLVIRLLACVLPWVRFDNTTENTPEPGLGTSIMPSEQDLATFMAHPRQTTPVVMINWLRFRPTAKYDRPDTKQITGQAAYYLYGKAAFAAIHSLGGRAFFISRYQQVLIGNGGDPGKDLWNEFVLVEYPGRATFKHMASLKRYRAGLVHRQAGLAENGQGLVVSVSLPPARG